MPSCTAYSSLFLICSAVCSGELFDAMPESCKSDNWGMPYQKQRSLDKSYYDNHIRIPCTEQWVKTERPMSDLLPMATIIHSANTQKYDDFESIDMIPENKALYSRGSPWGSNFDFKSYPSKAMKAAECVIPSAEDTSTWEITRIGPFVTTGGYDWIQIGWDNAFGLDHILEQHPLGVYIIEQFLSPVLKDGTRLQNPPIHIHHIHVGPAPYVRQRFSPMSCAFFNVSCFNPIRTLEHHGDYNCLDEDGGVDCRIEPFPEGYGKLILAPLGIEGELNDVRAVGSDPMEWYFEAGIKWVPKDIAHSAELSGKQKAAGKYRAMSLHNIAGPGYYNSKIQKTLLMTFPIPTRYESIFWYTGRFKDGGKLLRNKLHAHNTIFDQVLFFSASPDDLGMTVDKGFTVELPFKTVAPADIGLKSNAEVKAYLLKNLQMSQESFDQKLKEKDTDKPCGYPEAACNPNRPDIICQAHTQLLVIDGFAFDRRQPTCCTEWLWESGQVFTVVGFNKHQGYPQGPHAPRLEDVPEYLNGHVGWWFSYDTMETPEMSHWGYSLYNHEPAGGLESPVLMSKYQKVAMYLNKYSSPHFNDWTKVHNAVPAIIITSILDYPIVLVLTAVLLFSYCCCCRRKKDDMSHKKNDGCAERIRFR